MGLKGIQNWTRTAKLRRILPDFAHVALACAAGMRRSPQAPGTPWQAPPAAPARPGSSGLGMHGRHGFGDVLGLLFDALANF
jgi:hypothetical protein